MLPPYVGVGAGASSALPNAATSGRVRVFLHYGADHDICIAQPSVRGRCLAVACWHRTWCDCVDRGGVAGGTGMLTWHSRFSGCDHTTFAESSLSRYATMTACHSHSGLCATCLTTTLLGAPTTCSGQSQDGGGRGCACHPDELPCTVGVVARVLTSAVVWPTVLTAVCVTVP